MSTLVAIGYPDQGTAEQARGALQRLEDDLVIHSEQVASISRDVEGRYHVHTTHGVSSTTGWAAVGGLWGILFGLIFFIPVAGLALGVGVGALFGRHNLKGVDDEFKVKVRDYVQPGTSALFIVVDQASPDQAIASLAHYGGTVIKTSLADEEAQKLEEALRSQAPAGTGS